MSLIEFYAVTIIIPFCLFVIVTLALDDRDDRRAEHHEAEARANATGRLKPSNRGRR